MDKVLSLYSKAFNASKEYKGEIVKLRYMEETVNTDLPAPTEEGVTPVSPYVYGSRFLLELDVQLYAPEKQLVHTSEYVYLRKLKDSSELCHPTNLQWKKTPTVKVYFIVTCEWAS